MRPSEVPEGGKFRASPAAALLATAGAWGDLDCLCVTIDAAGDLIVASATNALGVIWVPEGRKDSSKANYKQVQDRQYTVFRRATFQEAEIGSSPTLTSGNKVYAAAAGDVVAGDSMPTGAGVGAVFIGWVLPDPTVAGGAGLKLVLDVNGWLVGLA